jgi:hypothetical protein
MVTAIANPTLSRVEIKTTPEASDRLRVKSAASPATKGKAGMNGKKAKFQSMSAAALSVPK